MFCRNCGKELPDGAKFCNGCGTKVGEGNVANKEAIKSADDKEVIYTVKPTYKAIYMLFPMFITFLIILGCLSPVAFIDSSSDVGMGVLTFFTIFFAVIILLQYIFTKKQYDAYEYNFYKTKIVYKDGFFNKSEKEVKYKHIREIVMSETLIQRLFKLGTIRMFTNAESGFSNGIFIMNVANSKEVYEKIKEIVNK